MYWSSYFPGFVASILNMIIYVIETWKFQWIIALQLVSTLASLPILKRNSYIIARMIILEYIISFHYSPQNHVTAPHFTHSKIWPPERDTKDSSNEHLAPWSLCPPHSPLHSFHSRNNGLISVPWTSMFALTQGLCTCPFLYPES